MAQAAALADVSSSTIASPAAYRRAIDTASQDRGSGSRPHTLSANNADSAQSAANKRRARSSQFGTGQTIF
ncbi:MAG: hypothetical protein WC977_12390, partial [Anaerovoracaceae bacterium]